MPDSVPLSHSRQTSLRRWVLVPALLLTLATIALFTVDLPLARACAPRNWPDEIHRYLRSIEPFGTIYGHAMLMLGLYCVLPAFRRCIPRIIVAPIAAGMTANVIKLMIGRQRPKYFDVTSASATDAFERWFPLINDGVSLKSFPSAHTASAVAFAVVLTQLFPRGKWLFGITAALVALQRIEVCEHFLSDVFVGATVGWLIGNSYLHVPKVTAWFDRFEAAGNASSGEPSGSRAKLLEIDVDRRRAA